MSETEFVVVGEAVVDIVDGAEGARAVAGGSPLNVAVGLARLDHDVTLETRFGDDAYGRLIGDHLARAGVRLAPGAIDSMPTSTARARLDDAGAALYDFDLWWSLPPLHRLSAGHAHTGSLATVIGPGDRQVLDLLYEHAQDSTVSFDPNIRPQVTPDRAAVTARVEELVSLADIVKVSEEDVHWLAPGADIRDIAAGWLTRGPSIVVVTRGGAGAYAAASSGDLEVPARPVTVVDTIGAGDAFMSGLLDGLAGAQLLGGGQRERLAAVSPDVLQAAVRRGVAAAAVTCSRTGANPPSRAELAAADRWPSPVLGPSPARLAGSGLPAT